MDYKKMSLKMHEENKGKIEIVSKVKIENRDDLSSAYTPGVAAPCVAIKENEADVYKYTAKGNLVAVISDGSAVLGLGNIGAKAAIPVMEGKCILFKEFAEVDAFPLCLETQDTDKIIDTIVNLGPVFGGINLEDISSPRCVEIERALKKKMNIPIFHDDQHGTAIVVSAALINSLKIVKKSIEEIKVVINGAGAAGIAIANMLISMGVKDMIVCDSRGTLSRDIKHSNWLKDELAEKTNSKLVKGSLACAIKNSDVFIGVSAKDALSEDMVRSMNSDAIVFAMANPDPEITPDRALKAGARIVGTGRSDYDNQINNVLAFPGLFRGVLDARGTEINEEMKKAAAIAIANFIDEKELNEKNIIPSALDKRVADAVAKAVYKVAKNHID